jgi:hypothetical protein
VYTDILNVINGQNSVHRNCDYCDRVDYYRVLGDEKTPGS